MYEDALWLLYTVRDELIPQRGHDWRAEDRGTLQKCEYCLAGVSDSAKKSVLMYLCRDYAYQTPSPPLPCPKLDG